MKRNDRVVTVALAGDVMLGRLMNDVLSSRGPTYPWGDTLPLLRESDLTIINLECVISDRGRPWRRTPKVFHFRATPLALDSLVAASVDVVSLANNHVLDYEEAAFLDMLDHLSARGIAFAGAGRNLAEAMRPAIVAPDGPRVAVLALTDNEPDWAAGTDRPGTHFVPITTDEPVRQHVADWIADARPLADFLIVSAHWGPNMVLRPFSHHRRFAHLVIDAGADLFVGHSAHVFQGIEWYRGKPILYDLGDYVDDYAVDPLLRNDWALLFRATIRPPDHLRSSPSTRTPNLWRVERLELVPLLISSFQVNRARGDEQIGIIRRVTMLCAELGTQLERADEHLISLPS